MALDLLGWILLAAAILLLAVVAVGAPRRRRSRPLRHVKGGMVGGSASYPHVEPWP